MRFFFKIHHTGACGFGVAKVVKASVLLVEIGPDRVRVSLKAPTKKLDIGKAPAQMVPQ